jgi:hypothetical protein
LTVRLPLLAAFTIVAGVVVLPSQAEAQRHVAVRRPPVAVRAVARPAVVVRSRPAVVAGGYYGRPYYGSYRSTFHIGIGFSGYYGFGGLYGFGGYYAPYYAGGYYRPYYAGSYGPYFGGPWTYPAYPYYGYGAYDHSGNVRAQVTPRHTEVFVDGYYAGTVDDFDGTFQRLHVEPGDHSIELFLPGHRPHQMSVYVQPGRTFNIRHVMEPLAPGEAEPARPSGAPLPPGGITTRGPAPRDPGADPGIDPRVTAPYPPPPGPPRSNGPQASAQGFGQLSLRVQPGDAEVQINGERWEGALTNERLEVQLGAGLHRLEIRKDGYRSYFTDVTILNGQTRTLNVALTKQ